MIGNTTRVLAAIIAGIMIVALLAACGELEKNTPIGDVPERDTQITTRAPEVTEQSEETELPENIREVPDEQTEPVESDDTPDVTEEVAWMKTEASQKIVDTSITQLGVPFKQGGDSPDEGFDSSGFIYYCVKQAGMAFPRNLKDQLEAGERISYNELIAGDIVYFSADEGGVASFGGIYVGGGLMIYSPVPDDYVKTANITTNYWVTHFVTGIRPMGD